MSQSRKHPTLGVILAISSTLLFGLNASTTKVLIDSGISAEQLTLMRSGAVALLAGLALAVTSPKSFKITWREVPFFAVFGVVGVGLMQWAYSNAVANLQVGVALLIEYTAIVIVPIATYLLFKEKVRGRIWIAVALVLGGLAIVAKPWSTGLNPEGVTYGFMAAVFLSAYFIMGERVQRKRDALSTMFYAFSVASIFWAITMSFQQVTPIDFSRSLNLTENLSAINLPTWGLLLFVMLFGSFVPMLLTFSAMRHLSASAVGIASTSETVFAFVFGYLWLSQLIDFSQAIGGVLVIIGIVVAQTARSNTGNSKIREASIEKKDAND
jgi:drug/metabolite transporter (DMT)-like permease